MKKHEMAGQREMAGRLRTELVQAPSGGTWDAATNEKFFSLAILIYEILLESVQIGYSFVDK